jgi:hypothetical protein
MLIITTVLISNNSFDVKLGILAYLLSIITVGTLFGSFIINKILHIYRKLNN